MYTLNAKENFMPVESANYAIRSFWMVSEIFYWKFRNLPKKLLMKCFRNLNISARLYVQECSIEIFLKYFNERFGEMFSESSWTLSKILKLQIWILPGMIHECFMENFYGNILKIFLWNLPEWIIGRTF